MNLPPALHPISTVATLAAQLAVSARKRLEVRQKSDGSLVTNADVEVEALLQAELCRLRPAVAFWGEESGFEAEASGGLWAVDPIDGTTNFRFGSPLWGVSIALIEGEEVTLSAIALPDLDELYVCEKGSGVWVGSLATTGSFHRLPPWPSGPIREWEPVSVNDRIVKQLPAEDLARLGKLRCSGAFVIDGTFLLRQRLRALYGCSEELYDAAAVLGMARELGGEAVYLDGSAFLLEPLKGPIKIDRPWVILPPGSPPIIEGQ